MRVSMHLWVLEIRARSAMNRICRYEDDTYRLSHLMCRMVLIYLAKRNVHNTILGYMEIVNDDFHNTSGNGNSASKHIDVCRVPILALSLHE